MVRITPVVTISHIGQMKKSVRLQNAAARKLGLELIRSNRLHDARIHYIALSRAHPRDPEVWFLLAAVHGELGEMDAAVQCGLKTIALRPNHADAYYNLAQAHMHLRQTEPAIAAYREVLRFVPDHVETYNNLGMALKDQARIEESLENLRQALRLRPGHTGAQSNLLFFLNYLPGDPEAVFAEHRAWASQLVAGLPTFAAHSHVPDPERRLRVGYVSPDFRTHSVAYFLYPLLAHHDPQAVEFFCYSNVARPDGYTARFRELPGKWRDISRMSDDAVAANIRADAIDILVDLAGHTGGNRLPVFACRPAPVQVTYLGYPNTTGLAAIDYRLTDAAADPVTPHHAGYTERLLRLPGGFLCYAPPTNAPDVSPPPAVAAGYVSFGSFNNLAKLTPAIAGLWSRILRSVPGSRLVLKNKSFTDAPTRERWRARFGQLGIEPARLALQECTAAVEDHLAAYAQVDVALDTFPYNGTTTTCEAMWMGVPVVTLAGDVHAARVGRSLLSQVGLPELIASEPDEYVGIAVELAQQASRRAALRRDLRARVAASPLCDAPAFAREVEKAYRAMWYEWCAKTTHGNRGGEPACDLSNRR